MNSTYKEYLAEMQQARQYELLASAVSLSIEGIGEYPHSVRKNWFFDPGVAFSFNARRPTALIPGTPCYRTAKQRKNRYLASARRHNKRAASLAAQLGIAYPPVFWKPRPATAADRRIAKQYDPSNTGWDGNGRDSMGVYCYIRPSQAARSVSDFANVA
jgi:hypothetical protein